jgi:ABC-type multidrug transport system ATPase subunit
METTHVYNDGPAVLARDLRKSYGGVEAVRGVSFEVARGEVFCLLGPNGAGKTTTVEILEGYRLRSDGDAASSGSIRRQARESSASGWGSSCRSAACRAI